MNNTYDVIVPKWKSTELEAKSIKDISGELTKFSVIGIIVNKLPVKRFIKIVESRKQTQAVLTFTIRDSQFDWINCSYWGSFVNVSSVASSYFFGDCVILNGVRAKEKVKGSYEDMFMVNTPSNFHLIMNDTSGKIDHFDFPDKTYTAGLKSALIKPGYQHTALHEIIRNTHSNSDIISNRIQTATYTFFAVVAEIGTPKPVTLQRKNKPGKMSLSSNDNLGDSVQMEDAEVVQKCELIVFDDTCTRLPVVLWNEEWIHLALTTFIPNVTILSFVDCPVRYDHYRRGVVASPNSRSLIIVAPECEETNNLSQYTKHAGNRDPSNTQSDFFSESTFTQAMPVSYRKMPAQLCAVPLNSIHHIVTINEVKAGKAIAGYGIVFALISKMDLDRNDYTNVLSTQCCNCQRRMIPCDQPGDFNLSAPGKPISSGLSEQFVMCVTSDCPMSAQRFPLSDTQHVQVEYSALINLSDHTGTYYRCIIAGDAMYKLLGVTTQQFICMSINERAQLKWKSCLRRFKIYFWTEQASFNNPNPFLYVLSCEKPSAFEVMHSLKNQSIP